MTDLHPYSDLPDHCFWSRVHGQDGPVDPVVSAAKVLTRDTKIATAGSCFAQHIARHLRDAGFHILDGEPAHPVIAPDIAARFGHGVFSARYGNVYSARQMLQLLHRARGEFIPADDIWEGEDGQAIDPFRPTIQPGGFADAKELAEDRKRHFGAVRQVLDDADVLIFTLGLTEAWRACSDGAVYPLAPGVAGGTHDPAKYEFVNFTVDEVVHDFNAFVSLARQNNPELEVILTVSPVPLAATARADQNVIAATAYSKAVLRVAAEMLAQGDPGITYFPSYEIITGAHARGRYFKSDFRAVDRAGVRHVMSVFSKHFAPDALSESRSIQTEASKRAQAARRVEQALDVICDEERLDGVGA